MSLNWNFLGDFGSAFFLVSNVPRGKDKSLFSFCARFWDSALINFLLGERGSPKENLLAVLDERRRWRVWEPWRGSDFWDSSF